MVFVAAGMRIVPHPANVALIGAMALFGGAYFKGWRAFGFPLLAMFISDIFLGFHGMMGGCMAVFY